MSTVFDAVETVHLARPRVEIHLTDEDNPTAGNVNWRSRGGISPGQGNRLRRTSDSSAWRVWQHRSGIQDRGGVSVRVQQVSDPGQRGEPVTLVGVIFLCISLPLAWAVRVLDARLRRTLGGAP